MKLIALISLPVFLLGACKEESASSMQQIKSVKTIVVTATSSANTRTLSGVVKTAEESDLSFRVGGRVQTVNVKLGQFVEKGQVLATLEQNDYLLDLQIAKSNLQSSRSDLETKRQDITRQRSLLKKNFVSQAAVEKSETSYQLALSNVETARSKLQTAEDNLERTVLRAPFSGTIAKKDIEPFVQVSAGAVLFALQGGDGLEVEVSVPETLISDVNYGDISSVSFPTVKGVSIGGIVSEVGAQSESGNAYPVTIQLAETSDDIRPGMTAEVSMRYQNSDAGEAFLLPTTSVDLRFFDSKLGSLKGQAPVFVVNKDRSTLNLVHVNISDVRRNQLVVTEGLNAGDRVVVAGVSFLSEGQKVKLWEPTYTIPATLNK